VHPPELQLELPVEQALPLVPVGSGTQQAGLPVAMPCGQLLGMRRQEQHQQAPAGLLQEEPL